MSNHTALASAPIISPESRQSTRRAVCTSVIGQVLEWYDFFLYGTAAALVFGQLFFPIGSDPLTGTIAAFGGFAVGFIARPIGGLLCGHLGDRRGRKFVMTLTLGAMGVATFAMGLLPTYAEIGILAPLALVALRLVQGLAAGGEWSGSILVIGENTPRHKRARLTAFSPCGAVIGFVLSTAAFMLMQWVAGDEFIVWGWRVPFLFSVVLIAVGVYLRRHMSESNEFAETKKRSETVRAPLVEVLRAHPREVLMVFGLRLGEGTASWIFFAFSIAYGKFIGLSDSFVLAALTFSMLTMIPVSLLSGYICDRIGRKPVYLAGSIGVVAFAYPLFVMLDTRDPWIVVLALVIANGLVIGTLEGAQPAFMSELLPAHVRYSGIGIGREMSSLLGGGIAPMIATALLAKFHTPAPIAIYLASMGMITVISVLFTPETYPRAAREEDRRKVKGA